VATGKLCWQKLLTAGASAGASRARPAFLGFSRDGQLLLAGGQKDDPVSRKEIDERAGFGFLFGARLREEVNEKEGTVTIFEAASGRVVRELPAKGLHWAALAPDGRMVVVATATGRAHGTHFLGIDVATGQTRWKKTQDERNTGFAPVVDMRFAGDSPFFQAVMQDGNVIRVNSLTGREQRHFLNESHAPEQANDLVLRNPYIGIACFSADGETLVTLQMGQNCVWDVATGTVRKRLDRTKLLGRKLLLSPDGRTIAAAGFVGSDLNVIELFDTQNGEQILTLDPGWPVSVTAFSPDGLRLYSGHANGCGIVWSVSRGQPRAGSEAKK
jgi:WD40 repeat protein